MPNRCVIACIAAFFAGCAHRPEAPQETGVVEMVVLGGPIETLSNVARVEAMAVVEGKIGFLGSEEDLSTWLQGRAVAERIDAKGGMVLPGFVDAHVHPLSAGLEMNELNLGAHGSKEEVLAAIEAYGAAHPDAPWVLGNTWELTVFPDAHPRKEWLDELIADRPAVFSAADGHSAWANSAALRAAGVDKTTPDPENGRIERDENGEPTGTLREDAMALVYKLVPEPTLKEQAQALHKAIQRLHSFGITGFLDAKQTEAGLRAYRALAEEEALHARARLALLAEPTGSLEDILAQVEDFTRLRNAFTRRNMDPSTVKFFVDGVIEAQTAALLQPYTDDPQKRGTLNWSAENLHPLVAALDKAGFQLHFHAIGDRGIRAALDAVEHVRSVNGPRDRRPCIAHVQLLDPEDVPRFAQLEVTPVFQPLWFYEDSYITDLTVPRLGPDRSRWLYAARSVQEAGAPLAMGSDWSVSSPNPLLGIETAVLRVNPRQPADAKSAFLPEQRLSLDDALRAYTSGSARAIFAEGQAGSLQVGRPADFVVLSKDLRTIAPEEISDVAVLRTVFEGKTVYLAK